MPERVTGSVTGPGFSVPAPAGLFIYEVNS
jgi:hypothetical protein